jgi:hypothetical protein
MSQKNEIITLLRRIANTSLLNTKPYVIADTNTHDELDGYAIYCLDEAVFNTATVFEGFDGTNPKTLTIKAGHTWYIKVSTVKLDSGTVFVYRA